MKKHLSKGYLLIGCLAAVLFLGFSPSIFTENTRVAYIESEEIEKKYPDYVQAQQRIDAATNSWKKEYEYMQSALRAKEDSLEKYRLIWSAPEKQTMEQSISEMKIKIQGYYTSKFGPGNSEYSQLNQDIMKPIIEKIFAAVKDVAKEQKYDYVFDKSGEILLLYANPDHDLTNDVKDKLGIKDTSKTLPQHQLPQHQMPGQQNGQQEQHNGMNPNMPGGQPLPPQGGAPPTPSGGTPPNPSGGNPLPH